MDTAQLSLINSSFQSGDLKSQELIEKCVSIALKSHKGQRDRDGHAVILHPLIVGSMGQTDAEKCVGFLHDVVEDTETTIEDLRAEGIPEDIIESVCICTRNASMTYDDYIQSIIDSGNKTAINVKLNDLRHNFARSKEHNYESLIKRYKKAIQKIEESSISF